MFIMFQTTGIKVLWVFVLVFLLLLDMAVIFSLLSLSTFYSPRPFTDGLIVLLCSLLLGESVIGELEAGDYFNVHTSFASLVRDAGVGMAVQHREKGLPAAQVGQL